MNKTPEETLKELERIADQSRKDAEAVKQFIEAQKAYNEIQKRISGEALPVVSKDLFTPRITKIESKINGAGRKSGLAHTIVVRGIEDTIGHANRFLRYSDIRPLADQLIPTFPKKTVKEIDKLIRNMLFKDRQSNAPKFAHVQEGTGLPVRYVYGLKRFLDEHGKIKPEHSPIE